jgi:hypothetical protein
MEYSIVRKILVDCFKWDRIDYEKTRVLTTAHDTDRSLLHEGKFYSPLVDTIEEDLVPEGVRCVSIARIISRIKGPRSYGNARSPEGGFARALVAKRLRGLFAGGAYPYSRMEEAVWGKILDTTGARRVVGILPSRELCVACHKRGVWVADVQHGGIADKHPWYGERFRAQNPVEFLPSTFLVWDRGSEQVIRKWSERKGIVPTVIGNRWLARFMKRAPEDHLVNELFEKFEREAQLAPGRPTILVALSWAERNIPNGFIVDGLEQVIRNTSGEYRWLIRLHPNQLNGFATHEGAKFLKYFRAKLQNHAEWELATRYPLPVILKNTDLLISWWSGVCIEAAQMGIRSALLNPRLRDPDQLHDHYEYYRGTGMVELVEERESSIDAWIRRSLARRTAPEDYSEYDRAYRDLIAFLAH